MSRLKDMTGLTFGKLTVIRLSPKRNKHGLAVWRCLCVCGRQIGVTGAHLRRGAVISCGCFHDEIVRKGLRLQHGDAKGKCAPEYLCWKHLKERCNNPTVRNYLDYGGRGIKVCPQWQNSYETFLADMGRRPSPSHSIHRVDNDGDYEPSNCVWATRKEQASARRKRRDNQTGYVGVHVLPSGRYRAVKGNKHLGVFDTPEEAAEAYERNEK